MGPDARPEFLAATAGLRIQEGRLAEAEALATRLVRIEPEGAYGWELLGAIRYLRDDPHGALEAWVRGRPPVVREVDIRIRGAEGPRPFDGGPDPARVAGLVAGGTLTLAALIHGSRRLEAIPAATGARLGYRALPDGEVTVEGSLQLGTPTPFGAPALAAHALRLLARRVELTFSDPFGRLERWEVSGRMEGQLREVGFALDHPAPGGLGVWRWELDHAVGRYGPPGRDEAVREERTSLAWSHTDWLAAALRGTVQGRVDLRPGRGTYAGTGVGWTLLSLSGRSAIQAEGMMWTRMGGGASGGEPRFGRIDLSASRQPDPPETGAPSGMALRLGIVAVSAGLPADLSPRIGAGGNTALLMRGWSDLDDEGVVRPLLPGTTWVHGGVEYGRPVGSVSLLELGVSIFADGIRILARDRSPVDPSDRRGALHLGAGVRARVPGLDGWMRLDWGVDAANGASAVSIAWVAGDRLRGLLFR